MKEDKSAAVVSVSGPRVMAFLLRHWNNNGSKIRRTIGQEFAVNGRWAVTIYVENQKEKRSIILIQDDSPEDIYDTIRWMYAKECPIIMIGRLKHIGIFLKDPIEKSRYQDFSLNAINNIKEGRAILIKDNERKYLHQYHVSDFGYRIIKEIALFLLNLEKHMLPNGRYYFYPQSKNGQKNGRYIKQSYKNN